jgi:hypothetical protein
VSAEHPTAKVYAVWEVDYEEQNVLSVWTTSEAAESELERVKAQGFSYGYRVTDHVLNDPWPISEAPRV